MLSYFNLCTVYTSVRCLYAPDGQSQVFAQVLGFVLHEVFLGKVLFTTPPPRDAQRIQKLRRNGRGGRSPGAWSCRAQGGSAQGCGAGPCCCRRWLCGRLSGQTGECRGCRRANKGSGIGRWRPSRFCHAEACGADAAWSNTCAAETRSTHSARGGQGCCQGWRRHSRRRGDFDPCIVVIYEHGTWTTIWDISRAIDRVPLTALLFALLLFHPGHWTKIGQNWSVGLKPYQQ